jgi:hypothetical protein
MKGYKMKNIKKILLSLFICILLTNQISLCETYKREVLIPDARYVTYNQQSAHELQMKFNEAVFNDDVIRTYLQYIAKDMKMNISYFQIKNDMIKFYTDISDKEKTNIKDHLKQKDVSDGYYFITYYKEGDKIVISRFVIDITQMALEQIPPTSFIPNKLGDWLKSLFGISKTKQLKKYSLYYDKIVQRMTLIVMQQVMYNSNNIDNKGCSNSDNKSIIIENSNITIDSDNKTIIIRNSTINVK